MSSQQPLEAQQADLEQRQEGSFRARAASLSLRPLVAQRCCRSCWPRPRVGVQGEAHSVGRRGELFMHQDQGPVWRIQVQGSLLSLHILRSLAH